MAKRSSKPASRDAVEAYARDVTEGRIVAGKLVKLACQRHLRDLKEGPARGLRWDREAAERVLQFFGFLRLPADGEIDGIPFSLQPFQQFIVGSLFGWKGSDDRRRFRTAYVEQGKGNGKTPLAAGIGLYGLVADGEAAAEIYPAATTREQAGILFRDAKRMAEASPVLREALDIGLNNLAYLPTDSFMRPVSSEHRGLDGKRPHICLIDEVHEHPTALVVDKMRAGTKARRQALIFEITNSGCDRTTVCWQHHSYSANVLQGIVDNDSWFAYVCQLDPCAACEAEGKIQPTENCPQCDHWDDERVWLKANPGLDAILPSKYLREQVAEAKGMPSKEGIVKRLNFCIWTEVATRAIPMDRWDACAGKVDLAWLRGREAYGGLDIGATSDFTAFVCLFPHDDEEKVELLVDPSAPPDQQKQKIVRRSYTMREFFWLPEHPVRRDERTMLMFDGWRRAGLVKTTPGEVVDYDVVFRDIVALTEPPHSYYFAKVNFDRGFQGCHLGTRLLSHFGQLVVTYMPQGIVSMNPPFREVQEMLLTGRLHHSGHPVMRWMAANCASEQRGGLVKPSKDKSTEKIDGITALTMAMAPAMICKDNWYTAGGLRG
jgi:phage terminase large subunit-like protein